MSRRRLSVLQSRAASSVVVYRGPSAYDGAPIVAIATGLVSPSRNSKTGPMAQLHILADGVEPHTAQKDGRDAAVCGDCPLRPKLAKEAGSRDRCYVKTFQGTLAAYRANRHRPVDLRGACDTLSARGLGLRLGSYGDPAALPESVVAPLVEAAATHTAYTHGRHQAPWLRRYAMASVETELQAWGAWRDGWRTFRTTSRAGGPEALDRIEVVCPHVTRGVTCDRCGLCSGAGPQRSITIPIHN